ncbi:hypothetical protein AGMMS49936_03320 [Endomicrobiia bacterium]|nr:hypothetical protein AGMMS49936_03320 [Endomicrobiia bacterium]
MQYKYISEAHSYATDGFKTSNHGDKLDDFCPIKTKIKKQKAEVFYILTKNLKFKKIKIKSPKNRKTGESYRHLYNFSCVLSARFYSGLTKKTNFDSMLTDDVVAVEN